MSKVISIRFSDLDLERLNKSAEAKETTTTEIARLIVQQHYENKNVNNKFAQITEDMNQLKVGFNALSTDNQAIIKGFNSLIENFNKLSTLVHSLVSQKQGATQ